MVPISFAEGKRDLEQLFSLRKQQPQVQEAPPPLPPKPQKTHGILLSHKKERNSAMVWMDLEIVTQSEVSEKKKNK